MRLDQFLVEKGYVESRTLAQQLISDGYVYLKNSGKILTKSSLLITQDIENEIGIKDNPLQKYVSRGGLKLQLAVEKVSLRVSGLNVLDVGQSTGGFTDYLLQQNVKSVVGIDVGQSQLADKIKSNPKVKYFEKLNVKDIASHKEFVSSVPRGGFDLIVMDVSFISILKVILHLKEFLKTNGEFLFLIKPQFELGAEQLDKNGVVRHSQLYIGLQEKMTRQIGDEYGIILNYSLSELPGKDGNQEFFIYGKKTK